jgi:diacylglycerol kinase family enzyme
MLKMLQKLVFSKAVTGLLRRPDAETRRRRPIGILPLGANNRLAKKIFHLDESSSRAGDVALMANAAMACVKQVYRLVTNSN